MESTLDLRGQDVAAPAVLDGRSGVPQARVRVVKLVEQHLLHVLEVSRREAPGFGETLTQVSKQAIEGIPSEIDDRGDTIDGAA